MPVERVDVVPDLMITLEAGCALLRADRLRQLRCHA
jgi:hypothetical protein